MTRHDRSEPDYAEEDYQDEATARAVRSVEAIMDRARDDEDEPLTEAEATERAIESVEAVLDRARQRDEETAERERRRKGESDATRTNRAARHVAEKLGLDDPDYDVIALSEDDAEGVAPHDDDDDDDEDEAAFTARKERERRETFYGDEGDEDRYDLRAE